MQDLQLRRLFLFCLSFLNEGIKSLNHLVATQVVHNATRQRKELHLLRGRPRRLRIKTLHFCHPFSIRCGIFLCIKDFFVSATRQNMIMGDMLSRVAKVDEKEIKSSWV